MFSDSLPPSYWGVCGGKWKAVWCWAAWWVKPQQFEKLHVYGGIHHSCWDFYMLYSIETNLFYNKLFIRLCKTKLEFQGKCSRRQQFICTKEQKCEKKVHFIFSLITKIEEYNLDWIHAELRLWCGKTTLPLFLCVCAAVSHFSSFSHLYISGSPWNRWFYVLIKASTWFTMLFEIRKLHFASG